MMSLPPTTRRRGSRGGRTTSGGTEEYETLLLSSPLKICSPSLLFVTHRHTNTLMTSYSLLSLSLYLSLPLPARSCSPSSLRSDGDGTDARSRAARESIHYYLSMTKVDNKTRACVSSEPVRGPGPLHGCAGSHRRVPRTSVAPTIPGRTHRVSEWGLSLPGAGSRSGAGS